MSRAWADRLERGKVFLRLASCDTDQKSGEDALFAYGVFTYYFAEALSAWVARHRQSWRRVAPMAEADA